MLYTKPFNKSYVDMCIEFDNEFYSGHRDDSKLYSYMYLIYYMLSCKDNYFHKFEDYDNYAQFSATTIYMRYLKKEKKNEKIKSLLNYAKSTAYPLKVMYQNENFLFITDTKGHKLDSVLLQQEMRDSIQQNYNAGLQESVEEILKDLPSIIKIIINNTPYSNDKLMFKRLYLSTMLTLLNGITLTNKDKLKCDKKLKFNTLDDNYILQLLEKERGAEPILWKLKDNMKDYVKVLANKVRAILNEKIIQERSLYELSDDTLDSIIASSYSELNKKENNYEE